jgi:hypothetical protein
MYKVQKDVNVFVKKVAQDFMDVARSHELAIRFAVNDSLLEAVCPFLELEDLVLLFKFLSDGENGYEDAGEIIAESLDSRIRRCKTYTERIDIGLAFGKANAREVWKMLRNTPRYSDPRIESYPPLEWQNAIVKASGWSHESTFVLK